MNQELTQNTAEWLATRKKYIGASDAPTIMGVSPWKTPYQLWQEKLGIGEEDKDSSAKRYGREHEQEARDQYQLITGHLVEPEVVFHPTIPYIMASLDGLSSDKKHMVEIKCPGEGDHLIAKEGQIPEKYYPQLMHQLVCAEQFGISSVDYVSYRNGESLIIGVPRDEKYIKKMLAAHDKFWKQVQNFEMPELTDRDLRERDEKWIEKARELANYKSLTKQYDELDKACTKELIELSEGYSSRGDRYRFKKTTRLGRINYSKIPELINIDLEPYREKSIEIWRLTEEESD